MYELLFHIAIMLHGRFILLYAGDQEDPNFLQLFLEEKEKY